MCVCLVKVEFTVLGHKIAFMSGYYIAILGLHYDLNQMLLKYEDMPNSNYELNFEIKSFYIITIEFPELELLVFVLW